MVTALLGLLLTPESFGAVKNHFPKNITALLALEGLKALQKINGRAHRVLLGGNMANAEAKLGRGGISAAWDAALCWIMFFAQSEDGEPRALSATPGLQGEAGPPDPLH